MRVVAEILKDVVASGMIADAGPLLLKTYVVLLAHADPDTFLVDSSLCEIAADAGGSNRGRVSKCLKQLEARGIIELVQVGRGRANRNLRSVRSEQLLQMWRAHAAVHRAIKAGTLKRGPCEDCGNPRTQAHHEDYSKPLVVRWKCQKHHRLLHPHRH